MEILPLLELKTLAKYIHFKTLETSQRNLQETSKKLK